jgi:hypothetical protein
LLNVMPTIIVPTTNNHCAHNARLTAMAVNDMSVWRACAMATTPRLPGIPQWPRVQAAAELANAHKSGTLLLTDLHLSHLMACTSAW